MSSARSRRLSRAWCRAPPNSLRAFLLDVIHNKLSQLIDDRDRIFVALLLRISPGKEAVAAQHDAVAVRTLLHRAAQHHGQFESRTLPWHPDQMMVKQTIELFHLFPAVGGGSQRNAPVRMQMIDVREGQKSVQRSVNRSGDAVLAEGAQRIHIHHFIFEFSAAILCSSPCSFSEYKRRQPAQLDASQIAATALDPQNFFLLPAKRIGLLDLRTGVSAAEVGDAKIGAQQIRSVAQQFRLVETAGDLFVPTVFQISQTCFELHGVLSAEKYVRARRLS